MLGGHTVKGFELDVKKALSKEEMKEAEYKQEQKQHQREERGRGDDRGRDEPMYKRQRMDQQWNSGSNIFLKWMVVGMAFGVGGRGYLGGRIGHSKCVLIEKGK